MRIVQVVFGCVVLFLTVSFAVSNKQPYALTLWPFPFEITLPVGFIILFFALLFFIFGGIYAWIQTIPVRNERWRQAKKIRELTLKIDELKKNDSIV